ncbi:DUF6630 family protein [Pseudomonas cuatrocienegasensis]|uniref:DUF6630 family protein n=1 Tax=Pseudomonas cuatrocienegasensis TaxID=543360 RepID=UPI001FC96737|nr:hypothetical protein [Pseudomonas cuatrocienegasensis]
METEIKRMGIWDRIFGGSFSMPPPEGTNLSDSECFKALRPELPQQRRALKALLEAILICTPDAERSRLVRRALRKLDNGYCPSDALYEGLVEEKRGQKLNELALMACDFRGFDSFEYLAPHLVRASGITTPFVYSNNSLMTLAEVLTEFDLWLKPYGRRYLHLNTGGDEYVGFIAREERVAEIIVLAKEAMVQVSLENF